MRKAPPTADAAPVEEIAASSPAISGVWRLGAALRSPLSDQLRNQPL